MLVDWLLNSLLELERIVHVVMMCQQGLYLRFVMPPIVCPVVVVTKSAHCFPIWYHQLMLGTLVSC